MIIVSGKLHVKPGSRATFLKATDKVVAAARETEGCRDFVIAADPLEKDRVNIYEEWESEAALVKFRGSGAPQDLRAHMVKAEIARHVVKSSGPP